MKNLFISLLALGSISSFASNLPCSTKITVKSIDVGNLVDSKIYGMRDKNPEIQVNIIGFDDQLGHKTKKFEGPIIPLKASSGQQEKNISIFDYMDFEYQSYNGIKFDKHNYVSGCYDVNALEIIVEDYNYILGNSEILREKISYNKVRNTLISKGDEAYSKFGMYYFINPSAYTFSLEDDATGLKITMEMSFE